MVNTSATPPSGSSSARSGETAFLLQNSPSGKGTMLSSKLPTALSEAAPRSHVQQHVVYIGGDGAAQKERSSSGGGHITPSSAAGGSTAQEVLIAGTTYVLTSAGLILFNKRALSSFNFQCPNCLLFFHCLMAVVMVQACSVFGLTKQPVERLRWKIVQLWIPVNLIFVGMIATSFLALQLVGVGMFTVLKNLSNLLALAGDFVFFGRTYPPVVWVCIALMIASAAAGGATDVHFNAVGYAWQLINCVFTSAYALYLSGVMTRVQQYTHDKQRMNELSMVYYNNLLSLGPILLLAAGFGELPKLASQEALRNPEFLMVAGVGGVLGFMISFSSLWFMSRSSATVFSLTGSMNKVLVALAGIVLFEETTTWSNLASIGVGLLAGTLFVMAKAYVVK